ncbi:MAG: formylglycine-generating enzyme family protein [bacterium]|nr:formylglycine-generating enzyme family protein [bacterium]
MERRLDAFLKAEAPDASTDDVIERLPAPDALQVSYGGNQFGFVHRSFQEYFAAWWMAREVDEEEFRKLVFEEPPGWNETLYMAEAHLEPKNRRPMMNELLKRNRIEFALACVKTAPEIDLWLKTLAQFLSKYYYEVGDEYESLSAAECAEACGHKKETLAVVRALFQRENRDGRSLASAVELAEQLPGAKVLLEEFFAESAEHGLHTTEKMARVDDFYIDKYQVTNRDFECMVPGHRTRRDEYSSEDDQPVIYVNRFEARLFCRWRGEGFRLPTEDEWYKAASWDPETGHNRKYPWGDEFDASRCNTREKRIGKTTAVGSYPDGASASGCYDMAGNVWEWMPSRWKEGSIYFALRGGSWFSYQRYAACADRYDYNDPHGRSNYVGMRCARTSS